jgi:hypothetical protein
MESTIVMIAPEITQTRLLMVSAGRDVLKAVLPSAGSAHRTAATTLLEGLALWYQQRLSVVLCVEEQESSCDALYLCDALGYGIRQLHFDIGVTHRRRRRSSRCLTGVGDFRDLRQLHLELQ